MSSSDCLVHICCGPCLCGVFPSLSKEKKITGFFYNPNIQPRAEYISRYMAAGFSASYFAFPMISDTAYDPEKWAKDVLASPSRCRPCVTDRLMKSALAAKAKSIPSFTTTLLVSPYQEHDFIRAEGERIASVTGIEFVYRDFRKDYAESVRISKKMLLYRQKYCGCVFSDSASGRSGGKKPLS